MPRKKGSAWELWCPARPGPDISFTATLMSPKGLPANWGHSPIWPSAATKLPSLISSKHGVGVSCGHALGKESRQLWEVRTGCIPGAEFEYAQRGEPSEILGEQLLSHPV